MTGSQKALIVVVAKAPIVGSVKTRLCPPLTYEQAARLYTGFLLDTVEIALGIPGCAVKAVCPTDQDAAKLAEILPAEVGYFVQPGSGLTAALSSSTERGLAEGFEKVFCISSDNPTLPACYLEEAVKALDHLDIDLVLGPSEDGGYYLIGARKLFPALFSDMVWSTETVLSETLARAERLGLHTHQLPLWYDLDTGADLARFAVELAGYDPSAKAAPHTRPLLAGLEMLQPGKPPVSLAVSVIIPVYNEVANISRVIEEIRALPPDPAYNLEIIVVDGGSKDGTVEAARSAGARVEPQKGRGYGAACFSGFEVSEAEIVVFLDGDYSDPPADLPALLAPLLAEKADLVLGSRTLGGLRRGALPAQAVWGNRLVTALIRVLYNYKLSDLPSFKALRRERLASFGMQEMTYGWTTEMLVKAVRARYRIVEVPVSYRLRGGGQSKVSGTFKGTIKAAYFLLKTTFRYTRWQPPTDHL